MLKINNNIFRAYDIRGIYPDEINEEAAKQIAKAFVKFLNAKTVVVGRDMRESSEKLHEACIKGLLEMGVMIYDVGLSSTPMTHFAVTKLQADGGIMVTASHNNLNYNGLKFMDKKSHDIYVESGLKDIKKLAENDLGGASGNGSVKSIDVKKDYAAFLKDSEFKFKNYKVVVDAMDGAMGPLAKEVLGESSLDAIFISCEPNSKIPGYETPNPLLTENRENIRETILEKKADLGVMFDGDGDRMAVVDEKGELVSQSFIAALVAKEILREIKGGKIVGDVRASHSLKHIVEENGGEYFIAKGGNPYVKEKMVEENATFGFETTGHMMFERSNYAEDTITGIIYLLNSLSRQEKSPQEIFDEFKSKYFISPETNYKTSDENILDKIEARYKDGKISKLDGITAEFPEYWFNIRKSNTEPLIRLNMEAISKEILEEKKKELTDFLLENGCTLAD